MPKPKMCPRCQQEFTPKRAERIFCSGRCAMTRDLPFKTCEQCGERFRKNAQYGYATWNAQKYCSQKCKGAARKKTFKRCPACGTMFHPDHLARIYCNEQCYFLAMRTDRFPVAGPRHKMVFTLRMKKELLRLGESACARCGATEHLEFDHAIPVFQGGSNTIENGQVLCRPCHRAKTTAELQAAAQQVKTSSYPS